MRRFRKLAVMTAALFVLGAAPAIAKPDHGYTCTDGEIPGGTYSRLIVKGDCWFGGDVTINGDVTVKAGAVLNDHAMSSADHVLINGNVKVGKGAVLGLGTYNPVAIHDTVVNGNISAHKPLTLYLSFITVHGNVVSHGGGSATEFRNFPTKDNVIDGNLVLQGWRGGWLGVIRNTVGGNVKVAKNASIVIETPPECDPTKGECTDVPGTDSDSTEVQTNVIAGNLICVHNTPAAQVNSGDLGEPNKVAGKAIGECRDLVDD